MARRIARPTSSCMGAFRALGTMRAPTTVGRAEQRRLVTSRGKTPKHVLEPKRPEDGGTAALEVLRRSSGSFEAVGDFIRGK